jgi:hypothetical protein
MYRRTTDAQKALEIDDRVREQLADDSAVEEF